MAVAAVAHECREPSLLSSKLTTALRRPLRGSMVRSRSLGAEDSEVVVKDDVVDEHEDEMDEERV